MPAPAAHIDAIGVPDDGGGNVIEADVRLGRQPARHFVITLGDAVVVFVAIDIGERDLENHERRALALREGEPVGAARRAHGVEAGPREQLDRR